MAKIAFTVEDTDSGGVMIVSEPSLHDLMGQMKRPSRDEITPAQSLALAAWSALIEASENIAAECGGRVRMGNTH